jgi:uncharacterized membrane protein
MPITRIALFLPLVFVFAVLYVLPHLSRRSQFFSTTVRPSFRGSNEARAILRKYYVQVTTHCVVGLCGVGLGVFRNAPNWLLFGLLWPPAGAVLAVVLAYREALHYAVPASGIRQASLRPAPRALQGGWLAWLGPFAILAASAAYVRLHWSEIPVRFPNHWGLNGQPNDWRQHTLIGVYKSTLQGAWVCAGALFLALQVTRNSRGSSESLHMMVRLVLGVCYYLAVLFGWQTIGLPLGLGGPTVTLAIGLGGLPVILGGTIFLGMRAKDEPEPGSGAPAGAAPAQVGIFGDYSADSAWKGGVLYFNPDDAALFVERRTGIGYTLNFGNPRSWMFVGIILLLPIGTFFIASL